MSNNGITRSSGLETNRRKVETKTERKPASSRQGGYA